MTCNKHALEGSTACTHHIPSKDNKSGFCELKDNFTCTDNISNTGMQLTDEIIDDFLTCKRLFYHKHICGIDIISEYRSPLSKMNALWLKCQDVIYDPQTTVNELKRFKATLGIDLFIEARVRALFASHRALELKSTDGILLGTNTEYEWESVDHNLTITGKHDRIYVDHVVFCGIVYDPIKYTKPFNLLPIVGTQLIANELLEHVTMEIVRLPTQKPFTSEGKRVSAELPNEYFERLKKDILSRPLHYFMGYNKKYNTWGKKFYRDEFDLNEIDNRYRWILQEIQECVVRESFYMNEVGNNCEFDCEYYDICNTGGISEVKYVMRDKPKRWLGAKYV